MSAFTQLMQQEERKITEMNLDEIKEMLCQLHGKDPTYCMDCKGIKGCPAGQRAVVLLDEYTKHEEPVQEEPKGGAMLKRARLLAGMEDPVSYLVEEQGKTYHHAVELVRKCKKFYPDLVKTQLPDRTTSAIDQSERLMREVLDAEDPVQFLFDRYHIPKVRGRDIVKTASAKWGKTMEDELSVDDFIQTLEPSQEPDKKPATVEPAAPDPELYELPLMQADISAELNLKFLKLTKREEEIREKIKQLEVDLHWIEKSKDALALVTNLFDPNSAIGKSLITE